VTGQRWIPPVLLYWNASADGRDQMTAAPCTRQQTSLGSIEFTPFNNDTASVVKHMPHTISRYGDAVTHNVVDSWKGQAMDYNHVTLYEPAMQHANQHLSNKNPLMTWHRVPVAPLSKHAMMSNAMVPSNSTCNRHVPWRQHLHDEHATDASHWTRQGFPEPGLYYGDYGPHGQELLYCFYQGYELIAMKIVGDQNVPVVRYHFVLIVELIKNVKSN